MTDRLFDRSDNSSCAGNFFAKASRRAPVRNLAVLRYPPLMLIRNLLGNDDRPVSCRGVGQLCCPSSWSSTAPSAPGNLPLRSLISACLNVSIGTPCWSAIGHSTAESPG
jgi:hypothetical protein